MSRRSDLEAHAARNREELAAGKPRTPWTGGDLRGAHLTGASLSEANLRWADLTGAILSGANLRWADLRGATLPDGRTLAEWQADPLAGLCTEPEAVRRATAAWGVHSWKGCPMNAGLGISSVDEAPEDKRLLVATFVALFDGRHLPKPGGGDD